MRFKTNHIPGTFPLVPFLNLGLEKWDGSLTKKSGAKLCQTSL